ncbi:hypothetical protein [Sulfitobacter sp. PM12]|uniref:hypothetical protein n=1 Tax=Sulfitobacter sp. PM12 TaxID=3138497 RepID=UPI00388F6976
MAKLFSFPALATLAMAVSVSACDTMNPAGLIAASRLDPLNTPPSEIEFAVGVPQTLRLTDGDAEFRIAFSGGTAVSTILIEETAPLLLIPGESTAPEPNAPDETVYIARIAPQDAARIAAAQREIRQLRSTGTQGDGSLTVRVVGGCFTSAPPTSIAVSSWLQTDPADGFVALTRQQDVARAIGARDAAILTAQLSPCPQGE